MDTMFTVTTNGKIYCAFCTRELAIDEECHCKGAEKARAKAQETAKHAALNLPNHKHDRPPRGLHK